MSEGKNEGNRQANKDKAAGRGRPKSRAQSPSARSVGSPHDNDHQAVVSGAGEPLWDIPHKPAAKENSPAPKVSHTSVDGKQKFSADGYLIPEAQLKKAQGDSPAASRDQQSTPKAQSNPLPTQYETPHPLSLIHI